VSDEARVRELDRAWNRAYLQRDIEALGRVLADDWIAFTPSHGTVTKAVLIDGQRHVPLDAEISFEEGGVHLFGDTAVTTGSTKVVAPGTNIHQRFTRVYAKRGGRWQAVAVQIVPIGES